MGPRILVDARPRLARVAAVNLIREVVAGELTALLRAHKLVQIAERLLAEAPGDRVLVDKLAVAEAEKREATQILKAALHAKGYTYEDLQRELGRT